MKKNVRNTLLIILIPVVLFASFFVASKVADTTETKKYHEIVELIKNNEVSEFKLNLYSGDLTYTLRGDGDAKGKTYHYTVPDASFFYNDINEKVIEINEANKETDKIIKYDYIRGGESTKRKYKGK